MRHCHTLPVFLLAALCVCLISPSVFAENDKPRKFEIDLDADVLVFTEPVRDDGTIDYLAAFNKQHSAGVTIENNAFRGLFLLFDQSVNNDDDFFDDAEHRAATVKALGITEAELKQGPKYVAWETYAEERGLGFDLASDLYAEYWDGPYGDPAAKQYVDWLEDVEPALQRAMKVLDRSHYYWPMISVDDPPALLGALMPQLGDHRSLARGLQAWAFYKAITGEPEKAIQAMRAVRNLALHSSREGVFISVLVGISLDALVFHTAQVLIEQQALPDESLAAFGKLLREREPLETIAACLAKTEKAMALEQYMHLITGASEEVANGIEFHKIIEQGGIDVEKGLKDLARYYDGLAQAAAAETFKKRFASLENYHDKFMQTAFAEDIFIERDGRQMPNFQRLTTEEGRTDLLTVLLLSTLAPSAEAAVSNETGIVAKEHAARVALAIERYRLKHDRLPKNLDVLVPGFIDAIPTDPFNHEPMRYKVLENGFVVYAVGENLKDDGGVVGRRDRGDAAIEVIYGRDD